MIERSFGVLFKKFLIIYRLCLLLCIADMNEIVIPCPILHIISSVERKDSYTGTRDLRIATEYDSSVRVNDLPTLSLSSDIHVASVFWNSSAEGIEGRDQHYDIRDALIDHIWNICGEGDGEELLWSVFWDRVYYCEVLVVHKSIFIAIIFVFLTFKTVLREINLRRYGHLGRISLNDTSNYCPNSSYHLFNHSISHDGVEILCSKEFTVEELCPVVFRRSIS